MNEWIKNPTSDTVAVRVDLLQYKMPINYFKYASTGSDADLWNRCGTSVIPSFSGFHASAPTNLNLLNGPHYVQRIQPHLKKNTNMRNICWAGL